MPYPIPHGRNFEITYADTTAKHYMPTMACGEHYEISCLISGDRQTITPDRIFYSTSGCVCMCEPGLLHQTSSISDTPYKRILIKFSLKAGESVKAGMGTLVFDQLFHQHTHYFSEKGREKIQRLFYEMLDEYNDYGKYTDTVLMGMLFRLFVMIHKYKENPYEDIRFSLKSTNQDILKALEYMDAHFCESPSLEEVAAYAGLTPGYFSRLFKAEVGDTYTRYLLFMKLQYSRILLMRTKLSVQEIADRTGFCNGNYLSSIYKKYYKESPSEFRKHCSPEENSDVINGPLYDEEAGR